jgi:hypothetical protein
MQKDLNFGQAIEALKQGKRVARQGWNGKGMFIFMRPADELSVDFIVNKVKSLPDSVKDFYNCDYTYSDIDNQAIGTFKQDEIIPQSEVKIKFTAYLCMLAADGTIVNGWLASQTDILSEDWTILD